MCCNSNRTNNQSEDGEVLNGIKDQKSMKAPKKNPLKIFHVSISVSFLFVVWFALDLLVILPLDFTLQKEIFMYCQFVFFFLLLFFALALRYYFSLDFVFIRSMSVDIFLFRFIFFFTSSFLCNAFVSR